MDANMYAYPPGDPQLIDRIYNEFLSQGRFDKLRKECMANADTKPAYQNLQQRVENTVSQFLQKQKWKPDLNKNQLRDSLRKYILESGFLDAGINRVVDQVVNPNILATVFLPEVEEVVYNYFNIPRPIDRQQKKNITPLLDNDMNPPGVVDDNDFVKEIESDSRSQNVDSNGNRSEILFDRLKKEDEERDGNFENELKKKSNINDSTESLFEKISNESFCTEDKSDVGNNDSKEIIATEDLPDNKTAEKMELPSDDGESQESLSRMGVEKLQLNEADAAANCQDSDSQGPLEIDERTMSDSENSNDSILQQMSPISQGRLTPDRDLTLESEIKQEPEEKKQDEEPEVKPEAELEKPREKLPILEEKNPSTFVGRIPKIKKEDEDEKSKEKPEGKSADSSDDSGSANKSDSDDKKKAEEKKDEKAKDKYKDDKKHRDDKGRRKDDKSRSERSRDRSRDRKKDDKSKKKDDRDRDKDKDRSRSDKSRDKSDKKSTSSSHRSSSSSHHKSSSSSSHRDDSKSRDRDRSKHDRKDKDKRSDDKKKREDDKKKKSKSVDDHSKERNKKDDRRSTDRDSNERDKSSSTSRSQGESTRKKDKETKAEGSSKEKSGKEEKEKPEKKKDAVETEAKGKSEKEKLEKKEHIPSEKPQLPPEKIEVPPFGTEQVEENMAKMFSSESPIKKEIIPPPETSENLPPPKEEKILPHSPPPNVNFSELLKEGSVKKYTFSAVADDFYQKFDSVGFKYFEDWESKDYFKYFDCEDEFREFIQRAENDLSLISDDEETDSEYDFEEINSATLRNSVNGLGNFDKSLMFDPVTGDFYSWASKLSYENALNRRNSSVVVPHIETDEDEQTKEEKNKENQELKKSKKKSKQPKKQEDAQKNVLKHLTDGLIKSEFFKTEDSDVKSALEPEKKLNEVPDEKVSPPLSEELEKSSEETTTPNPETPSSLLEGDKNDPDVDAKISLRQIESQRQQKNPSESPKSGMLTRLSSTKSDESSDVERSDEKSNPPVEKVMRKRKSPEGIEETPSKKLSKGENLTQSKQKPKIRVGLSRPKSKIKTSERSVDSPVNNFSLPLSPESDDTPLNNGAPNPILNKRKRAPFTSPNVGAIPLKKSADSRKKRALQQKYDSQDLYKPRPVLTGSRTRNRSLGVDSPTTKADNVQNNS